MDIQPDLLARYDRPGPRYTSYPTADRFVEAFDAEAHGHWLANRNIGGFARPLGLYVHVPFCARRCTYCDFSTGPLAAAGVRRYLAALAREADRRAPQAAGLAFTSVFLGGGTPSASAAAGGASGARYPRRQRRRRRIPHLPSHVQSGIGHHLRKNSQHPYARHR